LNTHFEKWKTAQSSELKCLATGVDPKLIISQISEDILTHYTSKPLINKYDVYQHLIDYWTETMQDDCYIIATTGWKAETYRIIEKDKKGQGKGQGLDPVISYRSI